MQLVRLSFPVSRRRAAETTAALRQGAASGEEMVSGVMYQRGRAACVPRTHLHRLAIGRAPCSWLG